jgi:hypothetical protein
MTDLVFCGIIETSYGTNSTDTKRAFGGASDFGKSQRYFEIAKN